MKKFRIACLLGAVLLLAAQVLPAAAGLLDGRPATTNKMFWKMATEPGPEVKWAKKTRWVDDGAIVTSSAVSAGLVD